MKPPEKEKKPRKVTIIDIVLSFLGMMFLCQLVNYAILAAQHKPFRWFFLE